MVCCKWKIVFFFGHNLEIQKFSFLEFLEIQKHYILPISKVHITLPTHAWVLNFFFSGVFTCCHSMSCWFQLVMWTSYPFTRETSTFKLVVVLRDLNLVVFLLLCEGLWDPLDTNFSVSILFSACWNRKFCSVHNSLVKIFWLVQMSMSKCFSFHGFTAAS